MVYITFGGSRYTAKYQELKYQNGIFNYASWIETTKKPMVNHHIKV